VLFKLDISVKEPFSPDPSLNPLSRTQVLIAIGLTAVALLAIAKIWQFWGAIALLPFRWNPLDMLWGLGVGLGIVVASAALYACWPSYRQSANTYCALVLKPLNWPDLIWLGLLPGLSEELLFRGVMLTALGADPWSLVATSLCFGALHLSGWQQWPYATWATLVGLVLGCSALVTGNLLVPVFAHMLTNWLSSAGWKWVQRSHCN
jgi:hypothetical protein